MVGSANKGDQDVANPNYIPISAPKGGFKSFEEFYPFYLGEHANTVCRRLHLFGTTISHIVLLRVLIGLLPSFLSKLNMHQLSWELEKRGAKLKHSVWKYIAGAILQTYFWAWIGHFFFEKNKPATFTYPSWSARGDIKMWREVLSGKRKP